MVVKIGSQHIKSHVFTILIPSLVLENEQNLNFPRVTKSLHTVARIVVDPEEQALIEVQMHDFKKRLGYFGKPLAKLTPEKTSPADWWDSFGIVRPELQRFAIRILSLTCSSSGCERN